MLSKPPSAVEPPPLAFRPPVSRVLSLLENFALELPSFEIHVVVSRKPGVVVREEVNR